MKRDYKVTCYRKDGTPFDTKGFVVTDKEIVEQVLLIWNSRIKESANRLSKREV
ncbi:hypothetical protein JTF04_02490 [Mammaliicoccus vitulinus]|uniref:hypothetical protein n=1 Tax=Mammaliicoccus vitulinus TaxID=71237 RepID=UPI001952679A|nr:hypothetical protein [Mammaliicoccus vitulinus]MBM6628536.1 hypothetical protein [Mammaliicoccus vitulinus]MEB7656595.1 hypothetical protein [Mammaliicoccus vitulinus]